MAFVPLLTMLLTTASAGPMVRDTRMGGLPAATSNVVAADGPGRPNAGENPAPAGHSTHFARRSPRGHDCCDVLIPAAFENQLTADNATRTNARIVIEGANGPTTPEADDILRTKGTLVIPDLYANAGGVVVSYLEWLKNLSHVGFGRLERRYRLASTTRLLYAIERATGNTFSDRDRVSLVQAPDELSVVNSGLEETMATGYREIRDTLQRQPELQDLRTAAYFCAIDKVARAYLELGIFP